MISASPNQSRARSLREIRHATADPNADHSRRPSARDVIGIAQTGTGKTAAVRVPSCIISLPIDARGAQDLPCAGAEPERELSGQILDSFRRLRRHVRTSGALVIGGVSMGAQVRAVQNGVDSSSPTRAPARPREEQCAASPVSGISRAR